MASQDEEIAKLPLEARLTHKVWKARMAAYKELATEIAKWDPDAHAAKFEEYADIVPKMVAESNMAAQEAGIATALQYLENAPNAARTRSATVPLLIEKGIASTRAGTRTVAREVLLMYIEIDVAEPVVEELIAGFKHKQPKVTTQCIAVLREALAAFGVKTMGIKPVVKTFSHIFGHADKNVRAEAQQLVIEVYRWIREAVMPFLADLKPVQVNDLKAAFEALPADPPVATRLLRSQQALLAQQEATASANNLDDRMAIDGNDGDDHGGSDSAVEMDPYDLADPVDVLAKIPTDFETQLKSPKWKERKAAMEALHGVVSAMRLANQSYEPIMALVAKHIHDTNIMVATLAINCAERFAHGLRSDFRPYKPTIVAPLLEKCKEKKANVVQALQRALDAVFDAIGRDLAEIQADVEAFVGHKNPQVKQEAVNWMTRTLKVIKVSPGKKDLPDLVNKIGLKALDDSTTDVRDAGANMLGHLMKCVGEDTLKLFLGDVDKIKEAKICEQFEKAEVIAKPARPRPTAAKSKPLPPSTRAARPPPAKPAPAIDDDLDALAALAPTAKPMPPPKLLRKKLAPKVAEGSGPPVSAAKPSGAAPPRAVAKPMAAKRKVANKPLAAAPLPTTAKPDLAVKFKFTSEMVDELIGEVICDELMEQLNSANWKHRLAGMEALREELRGKPVESLEAELLVRQMLKKPGPKEANFKVTDQVYQLIQFLAQEVPSFGPATAALATPLVVEKIGDLKLKKSAGEALESMAEKVTLGFVLAHAYEALSKQRAPKVITEALQWIQSAILEFGVSGVAMRPLIDFIKSVGITSSNAMARGKGIELMVTLCRFLGPQALAFVQDINAGTLQSLNDEYNKVKDQPAPVPTRAPVVSAADPARGGAGGAATGTGASDDALDELFPRVDISPQINSKLMGKLRSDSWKLRKEGLEQVQEILTTANNRIKPNVGELWGGLKGRLADANKNLISVAAELVASIASAMGPPFEKQGRLILGPLVLVLADKKPHIRQTALNALTTIAQVYPSLDGMLQFCGQGLMTESPSLRKDLLEWLVGQLQSRQMDASSSQTAAPDLTPLVAGVVECLQDRTTEVRKPAHTVLGLVVQSVGYDAVRDKIMGAKSASRQALLATLDSLQVSGLGNTNGRSTTVSSSATSSTAQVSGVKRSAAAAASPTKLTKAQLFGRKESPAATNAGAGSRSSSLEPPSALRRANSLAAPSGAASVGPAAGPGAGSNPRLSLRRRLGTGRPGVTGRPVSMLGAPAGSGLGSLAPPSGTTAAGRMTPSPTVGGASDSEDQPPFTNDDARAKGLRMRKDTGSSKWTLDTLRPELVQQLAHQMEPHVNPKLFQQMFSTDHHKDRAHLLALTALDDGLVNVDALAPVFRMSVEEWQQRYLCHLDLVLKYLTIRFHDTTTTIWMKCLDLVDHLISLATSHEYHWSEYEASVFLPSFIAKLGDPKETIRARVTALWRRLWNVYPASRLFQYLLDYGLKSKNARVRVDTLEELGTMLQRNSLSVCHPQKFIPLVAAHISERDAHVRTGALNALVQVYLQMGDAIFPLLGRLSEKDRTILDERFKRTKLPASLAGTASSQLPPPSPTPSSLAGPGATASHTLPRRSGLPTAPGGVSRLGTGAQTTASRLGQLRARPTSMYVGVPGRDSPNPPVSVPAPAAAVRAQEGGMPPLKNHGRDSPSVDQSSPRRKREFSLDLDQLNLHRPPAMDPLIHQRPVSMYAQPGHFSQASSRPESRATDSPHSQDDQNYMLDVIYAQVTSHQPGDIAEAVSHLRPLCSPHRIHVLIPLANHFINALTLQVRFLFDAEGVEPAQMVLCEQVVMCLKFMFTTPELARTVEKDTLQSIITEILKRLIDPKLALREEGQNLIRSMNVLVVRILDYSNRNRVYDALLDILGQACVDLPPVTSPVAEQEGQFAHLTLKCIWKLSKRAISDMEAQLIQVDVLLATLNRFFVAWPEVQWRRRAEERIVHGDMPYRTVKSILCDLVKCLQGSIVDHLGLVPEREQSDFYDTIMTVLHSMDLPIGNMARPASKLVNSVPSRSLPDPATVSLSSVSSSLGQLKSRLNQLPGPSNPADHSRSPEMRCTDGPTRPRPLSMYGLGPGLGHSTGTHSSAMASPNAAGVTGFQDNTNAYRRNLRQWKEQLGYGNGGSNYNSSSALGGANNGRGPPSPSLASLSALRSSPSCHASLTLATPSERTGTVSPQIPSPRSALAPASSALAPPVTSTATAAGASVTSTHYTSIQSLAMASQSEFGPTVSRTGELSASQMMHHSQPPPPSLPQQQRATHLP
ncbi:hypothetical protein H4R34_001626 [Dimargaris verticillata]|uniref:TOG domain-containing protein n=1 Tax=Dimargaris verticillata TaxID=2761393 RepID=A0A9W8B9J2_9FUNG|nr:hypothetical protein H4R34_001626 [Dimargaris verticillata]